MSKKKFQKIKLLKIWELLCNESNEDNPIDSITIIDRLQEQGISCDRKTLYSDIEELNRHGYKVYVKRSRRNQYYVKENDFTLSELRILIDAVQAANFITEERTHKLVDKIADLTGPKKADILKSGLYFEVQKYKNEEVFQNVQKIAKAIYDDKKVSFKYFNYNEEGKIIYRKDGSRYIVNPLALMFNDNSYYLASYTDKYKEICNFRVDRISDVIIEPDRMTYAECAADFDIEEIRRKAFSMYTGPEKLVELKFDKSLIDVMMDKFGPKISIYKLDEKYCKLLTYIQISPVFFGWCAIFENKLEILSPKDVADEYKNVLQNILKQYT